MPTVFSDPLFEKVLVEHSLNPKNNWSFLFKMLHRNNVLLTELNRESSGFFKARLIESKLNGGLVNSLVLPTWCVPGTVFVTEIDGYKVSLTLKNTFQSAVVGLTEIVGGKYTFDYKVISEFDDS